MKYIDPTNPSDIKKLLNININIDCTFISQYSMHQHEQLGQCVLIYSLIRWDPAQACESTTPIGTSDGVMKFEVFDANSIFANGGYGKIYESLGTLSVYNDNIMFSRENSRLIKVTDTKKLSSVEAKLYQYPLGLNYKPPVVIEANEKTYLIMDRAPGSTLKEFLKEVKQKKQLTIQQRFLLCIEILNELITIENTFGIYHYDIKPENIMVNFKGVPLIHIIDFGVSCFKKEAGLSMVDRFRGTVLFAPPERFNQLACSGINPDSYSTAMVLAMIWGAELSGDCFNVHMRTVALANDVNMNYTYVLGVENISKRVLLEIELLLTKMSSSDPQYRMSLLDAKNKLIEISINYDAGFYEQVSVPHPPLPFKQEYNLGRWQRKHPDYRKGLFTVQNSYLNNDPSEFTLDSAEEPIQGLGSLPI